MTVNGRIEKNRGEFVILVETLMGEDYVRNSSYPLSCNSHTHNKFI
jgi:hypothetical protein